MRKPLLACLMTAAMPFGTAAAETPAASTPIAAAPARDWQLANSGDGCMVHSASAQGTVLSITAMPEEDALLFVLQNQGWQTLDDGGQYAINLEFDEMGPWEIPAVAQTEIDRDGPGLIFVVRPGREDGARFMTEFAAAHGMQVGHDGAMLDSLALGGSNLAMASMAQCMSGGDDGGSAPATVLASGEAVEI